jgi:hypothetical protein
MEQMVLFDMTPIEVEPTREEIEAARTESGWTRRQLAQWGVASPSCGHPVLLAVVVAAGFADKPRRHHRLKTRLSVYNSAGCSFNWPSSSDQGFLLLHNAPVTSDSSSL